ncbi:NUDIX domain-containing protein [Candidatus Pacearchaeota archaeon]|nr:NUDIX domain-containing protein [Candidatus Pacearchaeota archaeon]
MNILIHARRKGAFINFSVHTVQKKMKIKNKYRKGVFCILYHGEKPEFLLLHRKLHWNGWELCKGKRKNGESAEETAKREIKEETGQKADKIINLHHSGRYDYGKKFQKKVGFRGQTYVLFIAGLKSKKIRIDKMEHDRFVWTDYSTALKLLEYPNQRKCLKIAMGHLKK